MIVRALEPPFGEAIPPGPFRPAVGGVLLADLSEGIPALARALEAHARAPWCPMVLLLPDRRLSAAVLAAFEPIPGTWAPLYPGDYSHLPLPDRMLAAVRRRPVPAATARAQWLERRLRRPGVAGLLAPCLDDEPELARPPRTLTRRLHALGRYEVRDWRGLGALTRILAGGRLERSLEAQAWAAGVDPRTLRRWLRLATDLPWEEVRRRAGWEWVLESALRRGGYVEWAPVRRVSGEFERQRWSRAALTRDPESE